MRWQVLLMVLVGSLVGAVPALADAGGGGGQAGGAKPSGCICGASDPGGAGAGGASAGASGGGGACLDWCILNGKDGKMPDMQSMQDKAMQEAAKQGFEMGKNGVMQQMQGGQSGGSGSGSSAQENYYGETQQFQQEYANQNHPQNMGAAGYQVGDGQQFNPNGGTYGTNYQPTATPAGWSDGGSIGGGSVFDTGTAPIQQGGGFTNTAGGTGSITGNYNGSTAGVGGWDGTSGGSFAGGGSGWQESVGGTSGNYANGGVSSGWDGNTLGQSGGRGIQAPPSAAWGNPAQASLPNTPQVQAAGQGGLPGLASTYNGPSGAMPAAATAPRQVVGPNGPQGVVNALPPQGGLGGLGNTAQQLLQGMSGQGAGGMNGLQALSSLGGMMGGGSGGGSGSGSGAAAMGGAAGAGAMPVTVGSQASATNAQGCYYNFSNTVMCPQGTAGTSNSGCGVNPESRVVVCPLTSGGSSNTAAANTATQASQANAQGCYYNTQQMIMCPRGTANTSSSGCATNAKGVVMCPQVAPAAGTTTSGVSPQLLYQAGYLDAERGNGRDPRYANDPIYKRGFDDALAEDASSVTPDGQDASDRVVRERCADGFGRIATDLNVERGLVEISFLSAEELDEADYDLMDKYSSRALVLLGQMKGVYDTAKRDAMYGVPFEQSLKDEATYVEGYACGRRLVRQ